MNAKEFDFSLWESIIAEKEKRREEDRQLILGKAIYLLKEYFKNKKVEKVYLVGSILQEYHFFPFSDIDISVEGLSEPYFQTLVALEELLGREIDLIELETASLRKPLEQTGLRII